MKVNPGHSRTMRRIGIALICALGPLAILMIYGATSFAASGPFAGERSTVDLNGLATPTLTATPGPTRQVAWSNIELFGVAGGLPQTADWIGGGGGGGDPCDAIKSTPGSHYWVPSDVWGYVTLGDPTIEPAIDIRECGGQPDAETTYNITNPDGFKVILKTNDRGGLSYPLPPDSPPGTYQVDISSRYGEVSLDVNVHRDTQPHIYAADSTTGDLNVQRGHSITVHYSNFPPNARIRVGLYMKRLNSDVLEEPKLIDGWEVPVDRHGEYTELLAPPESAFAEEYALIACAIQDCTASPGADTGVDGLSLRLVVSSFRVPPLTSSEVVKEYFEAIRKGEYAKSWEMTSSGFKERLSQSGTDFNGYVNLWKGVAGIEIIEAQTDSETETTASVSTQLRLTMKDGRALDPNKGTVGLIRVNGSSRWQIDH